MPTNHFKLLGSTNPVSDSLGVMTQAIGFPLRDVEGGQTFVVTEELLLGESFVQQAPVGLGVALQVEFGPLQNLPDFTLEADGTLTVLTTDEYSFRVKFSVGRRGLPVAVSQIYIRGLLNGVQTGSSVHAIIDNPDIEIPIFISGTVAFTVGDVLTFEIVRDTDGNDSGGLEPGNVDVVGWMDSPSAQMVINRAIAVTP
jgi:hypothetical protein